MFGQLYTPRLLCPARHGEALVLQVRGRAKEGYSFGWGASVRPTARVLMAHMGL